jgi:two-component system, LytTR family, response regulator
MAELRVLIVDDEPLARDCIRLALEPMGDVAIVGECPDGESAVNAIRELKPDLVFLDVQMPGMNGFDVLEKVGSENTPAVVFVTAFDEHAIRAFDIHALDYVLKPFDDERFVEAVEHAREWLRADRADDLALRISALLESRGRDVPLRRLTVRERDRIRYVRVDAVDYFVAEGNYVRLHVGKDSHLVRMTLSGLESHLDSSRFVRIHRSTIVNMDRVTELQPWAGGDYIAKLGDGTTLRVSRTYRDALLGPIV